MSDDHALNLVVGAAMIFLMFVLAFFILPALAS